MSILSFDSLLTDLSQVSIASRAVLHQLLPQQKENSDSTPFTERICCVLNLLDGLAG